MFADDTARSGEVEFEGLRVEGEGFGGANPGAKAAVNAEVFVDGDFAAGEGDGDVVRSHPVEGGVELVDVAGEFDDEGADLVGGDLGADDAGGDVEVFGESVGDGGVDVAFGEGEGDSLFHGVKAIEGFHFSS